jgi:hypothetical protein
VNLDGNQALGLIDQVRARSLDQRKWMQRWPVRPFAEKKWFTTADAVDLPDYDGSAAR